MLAPEHEAVVPDEFVCPLTLQIMSQPLVSRHGLINFERSAILSWLGKNQSCPLTRKPMRPSDLFPNKRLEARIQDWTQANGYESEGGGSSSSVLGGAPELTSSSEDDEDTTSEQDSFDPRLDSLKAASFIELTNDQQECLFALVREQRRAGERQVEERQSRRGGDQRRRGGHGSIQQNEEPRRAAAGGNDASEGGFLQHHSNGGNGTRRRGRKLFGKVFSRAAAPSAALVEC